MKIFNTGIDGKKRVYVQVEDFEFTQKYDENKK